MCTCTRPRSASATRSGGWPARFDGARTRGSGSMSAAVARAARAPPSVRRGVRWSCCAARCDEVLLAELGWDPEAVVVRAVLGHPSFGFPVCEVVGCELPSGYRGNVCTTCQQRFKRSVAAGRCGDLEEFKRDPARTERASTGAAVRGVLRAAGSRAAGAGHRSLRCARRAAQAARADVRGVRRSRRRGAVEDVRRLPASGLRASRRPARRGLCGRCEKVWRLAAARS